ncbi:MAG: hypothetical protein F6K23_33655 [Okeania sp. SIO2C9]|uniref:hypothetical protein n=1 Tax=Okeania sp. SIO2C9 TaxID=2607791 RepID=UPI0013C1854D|nr:hypothetical protein [Okeania sp. SIO2C9]NEQ77527.1 hypothetical protein [Okeania sp. SIO2C9]
MAFLNHLKHLMPNKKARLHTIIHSAAVESGAIGLATAQIPGDRFVIGAVQVGMVMELAAEFGKDLTEAAAMSIIESAIATVMGVEIFNGVIKYSPGLGNLANMGTAASVTETIGWATVEYLRNS